MEVYGRSHFPPSLFYDIIDFQNRILFDTNDLLAFWIDCSNYCDSRLQPNDRIQQVI